MVYRMIFSPTEGTRRAAEPRSFGQKIWQALRS